MVLRHIALAALFLSASVASVDAGLIIKGVDTEIVAGSTGAVVFTIETDGNIFEPDLSPDDILTFFASSFQITTVTSTGGRLEFANTMLPPLGDTSYVLNGSSIGQITNPVFAPSQTAVPNDTLSISDANGPFPPAILAAGDSARVLARLQLTTLGMLAPVAGEAFDVTITPQTFFGDGVPNLISGQSDYTARVTIKDSTNAIPEPASVFIWAMVCLLGVGRRLRRLAERRLIAI